MQAKLTGANTILYDEISSDIKEILVTEARELLLIGVTLNRSTGAYYSRLEEKIRNKQSIRVLLVEPNSETSKLIPRRTYKPTSEERLNTRILDTAELLCTLRAIAPDLVEIRTINFPTPFRCIATNINSNDSSIALEYYSYKTTQDLPCVRVSKSTDEYWHSIYRTEILNLWTAGKPWTCQPRQQL